MCRGKRSWVMLKGVKFCPTPAVCGLLLLCVLWGRVGGTAVCCRHGPGRRVAHSSPRSGSRGQAFCTCICAQAVPHTKHRDDGSQGRGLDGNLGMMMRSHLTSVSSGALHGRAMIASGWDDRWDMQWLIAHRFRDAWLCDDAKSKFGAPEGGFILLAWCVSRS